MKFIPSQTTVLRLALDDFVDRQHKLAHTARTGGNLPSEGWTDHEIDNTLREQFACGCDMRARIALEMLEKLDQSEKA